MAGNNMSDYGPDAKAKVTLEQGDICIAATYREGEVNIRRNIGAGRVLVLNSDLTPKGALWTDEEGLVLGLGYSPDDKILYVSDATSQTLKRFSAAGDSLPSFPQMQGKPFGPIAVCGDGTIVIGEHIYGDAFPFIGGGALYHFDKEGGLLACHKADRDPGKFGFHGVTNMALSHQDSVMLYISETGRRFMQYDLVAGKQLEDLIVLPEGEEGEARVTAGFGLLSNGNILLAHVYGASLISPTGEILKDYDIPRDRGWAAVKILAGEKAFLVANFFSGLLEKRDIETGEILASLETEMIFTLASIAEIT